MKVEYTIIFPVLMVLSYLNHYLLLTCLSLLLPPPWLSEGSYIFNVSKTLFLKPWSSLAIRFSPLVWLCLYHYAFSSDFPLLLYIYISITLNLSSSCKFIVYDCTTYLFKTYTASNDCQSEATSAGTIIIIIMWQNFVLIMVWCQRCQFLTSALCTSSLKLSPPVSLSLLLLP